MSFCWFLLFRKFSSSAQGVAEKTAFGGSIQWIGLGNLKTIAASLLHFMQCVWLSVKDCHLLYTHGTVFVKISFSEGKAGAQQFPFLWEIIPEAGRSPLSRNKSLPFGLSPVTRKDKLYSVPPFGLFPVNSFRPWLDYRSWRWCCCTSSITCGPHCFLSHALQQVVTRAL